VDFGEPWRGWIHRFKHHGEPEWARLFGRILLSHSQVRQVLDGGDVWLPVPMSAPALGARGYNHAWELTRWLAAVHAGTAPMAHPDWLIKTADTLAQHTLTRRERLANLKHVFALSAAGSQGVHGRNVVLVDDVMTTGATLECAAAALLKGGATRVEAVVFARTPKPAAA
jgi:ComF family protein